MNGLIKTIKVLGLVVIVLIGAFYLLSSVGRGSKKSQYQESNSLLQQIKFGLLEDDMKTKTLYELYVNKCGTIAIFESPFRPEGVYAKLVAKYPELHSIESKNGKVDEKTFAEINSYVFIRDEKNKRYELYDRYNLKVRMAWTF